MKMPTRSLSFKVKALLVLGGLQLLGLLVLGFLAYEQSREALEKLAKDKLELTMKGVSKDLEDYIRDESRLVLLISRMPPIHEMVTRSGVAATTRPGPCYPVSRCRTFENLFGVRHQ